ncbi:hypothetical protein BDN71DRAFT_1512934 [Pleurotus eryngii]|uniref:Uncharacterized protein n=1 Tax=Pleurotus eryngii TaxID=5323 RepID=A0A9P5ZK67_PLEER|nr:hypothetical protein BDN71DRAFT_1512934 [Pleurotus eryngii]
MGDIEDSTEPWQEPLEKLRKCVDCIARNTQVAQRSADIHGAELKASKKLHEARFQAVEKDLKQRRPGLYVSRRIEASRRPIPSNNAMSHLEGPGHSIGTGTSNPPYACPQLHRRPPLSTRITTTPPIITSSPRLGTNSASSSFASLSDSNFGSNLLLLSLSSLPSPSNFDPSDHGVHSNTPIKTWNLYPSPPTSDNAILSPSTSDSVGLSSYLPEVSSSPCHAISNGIDSFPHLDDVDLLDSSSSPGTPHLKASGGVNRSSSSLLSISPESSELDPSVPPAPDNSSESSRLRLPMWLLLPLLCRRSPDSEQNATPFKPFTPPTTTGFTGPLYILCLVSLFIIGYIILAFTYIHIVHPQEIHPELLELMQEYTL